MKQKTKFFIALGAVCAVILGAAAAAGTSRQISVTLRPDITVQVDGVPQTILDSTGKETAPILYNGTTYLPVKSIGQVLGQEVTWDGKTNTVNISSSGTPAAPSTPSTPSSTPNTGSTSLIGEAKAKDIALKHAKLSASDVTFIQSKLEWEDGRQVYDVEFYSGSKEYDYEIDAKTGEILSYDYDVENFTPPASNTGSSYITESQAKKLAQDKAPKATLVKIEFDYDDGRAVYEGELREGRTEYEFKIDAATGDFLEWEVDYD